MVSGQGVKPPYILFEFVACTCKTKLNRYTLNTQAKQRATFISMCSGIQFPLAIQKQNPINKLSKQNKTKQNTMQCNSF